MSKNGNLTQTQEKARDLVRNLGEVEADPGFRARLLREFVTGRVVEHPPLPTERRSVWPTILRWAYIPAAAAIILVVMTIANQGPDWKVIGAPTEGTVLIDGQRVGMQGIRRLEKLMEPGAEIEIPAGSELTLFGQGTLVFQATPGTRMTIPTIPGRWLGRTLVTRVDQGEVRFLTGPEFAGHRLVVTTPEGRVEVTGTVISVLRDEGVTCVCVMSGEAMIGMNEADMEPIPEGKRKVMFGDGRDPMIVDILPEHRRGLVPFVDRNQGYLQD
jgi:hypothetical protein